MATYKKAATKNVLENWTLYDRICTMLQNQHNNNSSIWKFCNTAICSPDAHNAFSTVNIFHLDISIISVDSANSSSCGDGEPEDVMLWRHLVVIC